MARFPSTPLSGWPSVSSAERLRATKLQVRDRAQLLMLAYEAGVVVPGAL
jgi:hypothetical protein